MKIGFEELFGIDISEESIRLSEERLKKLGLSANLKVVDCLKEKFGFEEKFDVVLDIFSMNCLDTKKFMPLLNNIYDSLNLGDYFIHFPF